MEKQITITISDQVYEALRRRVGIDHIGDFVERLLNTHVADEATLEAGYQAMMADSVREQEALEWIEAAPNEALEDEPPLV